MMKAKGSRGENIQIEEKYTRDIEALPAVSWMPWALPHEVHGHTFCRLPGTLRPPQSILDSCMVNNAQTLWTLLSQDTTIH